MGCWSCQQLLDYQGAVSCSKCKSEQFAICLECWPFTYQLVTADQDKLPKRPFCPKHGMLCYFAVNRGNIVHVPTTLPLTTTRELLQPSPSHPLVPVADVSNADCLVAPIASPAHEYNFSMFFLLVPDSFYSCATQIL